MKRIVGLDLGDTWVGVAHTDPLQIMVQPLTTWLFVHLKKNLREYLEKYKPEAIVVGIPYTMSGGRSAQTEKIYQMLEELRKEFAEQTFFEQDERLSSQFAQRCVHNSLGVRKASGKEEHARAAALILENFLMRRKSE